MHVINYKYSKGLSAPVICVLALILTAGLVLIEREERYTVLPAELAAVQQYVAENRR